MKTILLSLSAAALLLSSCGNGTEESERKDSTAAVSQEAATVSPEQSATPQADAATTNRKMADAMHAMMPDMMALKMSGDPDHDFAMMMRSHHQTALAMVQAYLPGAADGELKGMAQKMLTDQQQEIGEMDAFMADHKPARKEPATGNELMKVMHNMPAMDNMPANPDQHFATMMIPHHQGAIDMSRVYLKAAKDSKMKAMAESIITAQEAEIKQLQDWLNQHAKGA